jgi:hypothetical protein
MLVLLSIGTGPFLIGPGGAVAIRGMGRTRRCKLHLIALGELFAFCHEYLHLRHSPVPSDKHAYLFSTLSR